MATIKYIINNLPDQTINGNLRLNGDLKVSDGTYSIATYRALLTQTATFSGQYMGSFGNGLIIGETYTITDYIIGDDFSNIADVISGVINETGCQFIATGELPNIWTNNSTLESAGNLVVHVLENTLGFDINWFDEFVPGAYFGMNATTGPIHNAFSRSQVSVMTSNTAFFIAGSPTEYTLYGFPAGVVNKDEIVAIIPYDFNVGSNVVDSLYYTPVQISFKQSLDTTPILATGSVLSSFPFGNVAVDLYAGPLYIQDFTAYNTSTVDDIGELVTLLNSDPVTNYLGTFAYDDSGNILLTIATNLKNQFSPNNTLTFEVYADVG